MKKVRFLYNHYSGENVILHELDKVIKIHQDKGYQIEPYRIEREKDISEAFDIVNNNYEYILVAGGDGTVDSVVNAMKDKGLAYRSTSSRNC